MRLFFLLALTSFLAACSATSKTAETPEEPAPMQEIVPIGRGDLELVEFHIYDDPSGIRLYWATEREENSATFHVERSSNGNTWEEIGMLAAGRMTTERTPYRFLDQTPFSGNNYYRIVLKDLEDTETVSTVESIKHFGFFNLTMFPNPAAIGQQITLNFEGEEHHEFQVELVDKSGMRIQRESFESDWGNNQLSFVPAARSRGKYFVYVFLDDYPVQSFTLQLK